MSSQPSSSTKESRCKPYFPSSSFWKRGHALERVVVIHGEALQVVPGVVQQVRADGRDAHARDVIEKLLVDHPAGATPMTADSLV